MFLVRQDDLAGPATRRLIALHLVGMRANSPPDGVFALDLSELRNSSVTVWTAWEAEQVASIGALKMLPDGNGEVKSMRTHPGFLRRGAAAQILDTIIDAASARGVRRLSLETGSGPAFEPALTLYRRRGFREGAPFAAYEQAGFNRFLHLELIGFGS